MIDSGKYVMTLPGRVVSFDATDQTADVLICVERLFSSSLSVSYSRTRDPIKGVPVHVNSGGGWSQTHPISEGDTCQVSFSQVGYDHWLYEDKDTAGTLDNVPKPWLKRQFSEDDGFCLVGYNTLPRAIQSYSAEHSEWRNADASQIVRLHKDGDIEITSATAIKLTAPEVTVQCDNATISATAKVEVTTPLLDLICATSVAIDSPAVTMSGTLAVVGVLTASEVTNAAGIVLGTHDHAGDGGSGSGASTGPPL